jgi:thiol-disulfide isomerase/thioredoxin
MKWIVTLLWLLGISTAYAGVKVSFSFKDPQNVFELDFSNSLTSDSVFSCRCASGTFYIEDVESCPVIALVIHREDTWEFINIDLSKPLVEFTIDMVNGLPELYFANDTFNQSHFKYTKSLRPLKKRQWQLVSAFKDTTQNIDSLMVAWKSLQQETDSTTFSFYYHHGHQSVSRLLYVYFLLKGKSLSADSAKLILNGISGDAKQSRFYRLCYQQLYNPDFVIEAGATMPNLLLKDFAGNLQNKQVDVNKNYLYYFFWATWCGGCKPQLKKLQEAATLIDSLHIGYVVVNTNNTFEQWQAYTGTISLNGWGVTKSGIFSGMNEVVSTTQSTDSGQVRKVNLGHVTQVLSYSVLEYDTDLVSIITFSDSYL